MVLRGGGQILQRRVRPRRPHRTVRRRPAAPLRTRRGTAADRLPRPVPDSGPRTRTRLRRRRRPALRLRVPGRDAGRHVPAARARLRRRARHPAAERPRRSRPRPPGPGSRRDARRRTGPPHGVAHRGRRPGPSGPRSKTHLAAAAAPRPPGRAARLPARPSHRHSRRRPGRSGTFGLGARATRTHPAIQSGADVVTKVVSLSELAARGSRTEPRSPSAAASCTAGPFAFVRELIRQGRTHLEIVKQSPGYDIDILCRAGARRAGARRHRRDGGQFRPRALVPAGRRERSRSRLEEHACATLTAGLRAAAFGVPVPCPAAASMAPTFRR